jgi:hypothetical protein
MNINISLASYFLIICIPAYIFYRLRKNGKHALLNVCLYPLILSYIYLCIPSALINNFIEIFFDGSTFGLTGFDFEATYLYSSWFTLTFLIFYYFSKDRRFAVNSSFYPKVRTYKIAKILFILVLIAYSIIIFIEFPNLLPLFLSSDRINLLSQFSDIIDTYRLVTLTYISMGLCAVISWKTRKFYSYLIFIPPIFIELLTLGRTISFQIIIFAFVNYALVSRKPNYNFLFLILTLLVITVFFRFGSFSYSPLSFLYLSFSDLFLTYLGGVLTYSNLYSMGNYYDTLLSSLLRLFPSFISDYIFADSSNIHSSFDSFRYETSILYARKVGFDLANNVISESIYYGGTFLVVIYPLLIASIFYFINYFFICKTFPGYIYVLILISSLRAMFAQSGFFYYFPVTIYLMFSYLVWLTYLERKSVFIVSLQKVRTYIPQVDK